MRVGERGQITIPNEIRRRFGLGPRTEVELVVESGAIVLRKKPGKRPDFSKWVGHCRKSFAGLGCGVDEFVEDLRGR
jgi:AbrB family looped-hinge helix DNA binding protein